MKVYKSVPMGFDIDQSYGTASDHLYCRVQDSGHRWFWLRLVFCFVLLILFPLNLQPRSQATPHQTRTITHQRQATGESHTAIINPILSSHVGCYNLYRDTKRVSLRPTCCTRCTPSFAGSLSVPKTKKSCTAESELWKERSFWNLAIFRRKLDGEFEREQVTSAAAPHLFLVNHKGLI